MARFTAVEGRLVTGSVHRAAASRMTPRGVARQDGCSRVLVVGEKLLDGDAVGAGFLQQCRNSLIRLDERWARSPLAFIRRTPASRSAG